MTELSPELFAQRWLESGTSSHDAAVRDGKTITFPNGTLRVENSAGTAIAVNRRSVIDTGGAFATPIVLTAAESDNIYLLDDAAGLDFTLPVITADNLGMTFEFRLITEVTSNSYRITAGEATDLFVGHIVILDKDVAEDAATALFAIYRPDGSDDDALTISGSADTSGALVGGHLKFEALTASRWFVSGSLVGDGDFVTVFS